MFSVPGIAALILLIYIKPQEFIPGLEGVPLLYAFLALAVFGLILDFRLGHAKFDPPPHWPYVLMFVPWCFVTYLFKAGGSGFVKAALELVIVTILFFTISSGVQTFRSFEVVMGTLLVASLFVTGVCLHQGFAPLGCAVQEGHSVESIRPDGRPCNRAEECSEGDAEPGATYQCERMGLFGTVSVGRGRVRYRGVLKDPNEVALACGAAMPALFARVERQSTLFRWGLLLIGFYAVAHTIIFTQSRGGLLVFLAVVGAYSVKKLGMKGIVAGGILALPLLVLGGRSGDEASDSANERTEVMSAGMQMFQSDPIFGVGYDQFGNHHHLTAHNSYLLALSELGVFGLFLFFAIMYISFKICWKAMRRYSASEEAKVAGTWSMGLLAAFCGVSIGSFFLSFTYHQVLWIYLGLSGALYAVVRHHDASFKITVGLTEKLLLGAATLAFPVVLKLFLRLKGH
jgi:O-antigen ligase